MKSYGSFLTEAFENIDHWHNNRGPQLGSNPGGIKIHPETKEQHYVKFYKNPEQASVEHATGKIYNLMGIHTPETKLVSHNGHLGLASKWNHNLEKIQPGHEHNFTHDQAHQIGRMYHAAVLTKNWDIIGLEHDNVLKDKSTGHLHSIDQGGSMHFRAMGGKKDFDSRDISERQTLRVSGNPASAVINNTFRKHPDVEKKSAQSLKNLNHEAVHGILKDSGIKNHKKLADTIMKRRDMILSHYGE